MNSVEKYGYVRGFNFQPPWGSNGRDVWLRFDAKEYRRIIRCAKAAFPKLNTLRVWLSFEGWYDGRETFVENVRRAGEIIADEGLKMIPVYFNGWHSVPDFGGFTDEQLRALQPLGWHPMTVYLRNTAAALETTGAVLMSDISNEPLNNVLENEDAYGRVRAFMRDMAAILHEVSAMPVTIGSQGYFFDTPHLGAASDMELFAPFLDVISLHPYSVCMASVENHEAHVAKLVAETSRLGKPAIVTECCWDADGDKARGELVKLELSHYAAAGLGFCVHALSPSPVADMHEKDGINPSFFMPFMYLDGKIRPYHEVFNEY